MAKHYFPIKDKNTDIIILSDVYKASGPEQEGPEVWKHSVREVMFYASTGNDDYGNPKNSFVKVYLNADDIINLSEAIKALRNRSASKEAIQAVDEDLPF